MANRITRLVFIAGGVVYPPLPEVAASLLAPGCKLSTEQRLALQEAARDQVNRAELPIRFCERAVEICGEKGEATPGALWERLEKGLIALPGMPALIRELAQALEVRLVSDYPPVWLLPALKRDGLADCFPSLRVTYVAGLGGYAELFDKLIAGGELSPGHSLWVDAHSPRTSEALRKGIDTAIFVDARRFRRDLGLWGLAPTAATGAC